MEMEAEPHPSFDCATKGTSIQTPGVCAARASPALAAQIRERTSMPRNFISSANGDNDKNQGHDGHKDDEQVAVRDLPRREILLRFFRASRQLRQIIVA